MTVIGLGIILVAAASAQSHGWTPCRSFQASGVERLVKGAERPFLIRRLGDTTLTDTTRAIDGYLSGVPRRELKSPSGVLTWIASRPHWALSRIYSSIPDYEAMFAPPGFDRSDINRGPLALERILGKRVQIGRIEMIAGRPCYPMRLSDRSAASLNWWVDQATGFRMKTQETVADQVFTEREFSEFMPDAKIDPADLVAPSGAKTILGIVSAGVLERADAPATVKQYEDDLAAARKSTYLGDGRWMRRLPLIPGFDYMLSELRENRGSLAPPERNEGPQISSGTLVLSDGGGAQFQITTQAKVLDSLNQAITLEFTIADPAKREAPIIDRERAAGASGILQSDFLNRATGDTVSFIQLRNAPLSVAMRGIKLPAFTLSKVDGLGDVAVIKLTAPFPLTIVYWRGFAGDYALASTSLGDPALIELAKKATNG